MIGRLESINASRGGVPKRSTFEALITEEGLDGGDRQRDLHFHGGPDRNIVLFSLDVIKALQRKGLSIAAGTTGENLTISGLDWSGIVPGTEPQIDEVRPRTTKHTTPCENVAWSRVSAGSSQAASSASAMPRS